VAAKGVREQGQDMKTHLSMIQENLLTPMRFRSPTVNY